MRVRGGMRECSCGIVELLCNKFMTCYRQKKNSVPKVEFVDSFPGFIMNV